MFSISQSSKPSAAFASKVSVVFVPAFFAVAMVRPPLFKARACGFATGAGVCVTRANASSNRASELSAVSRPASAFASRSPILCASFSQRSRGRWR